MSIYLQLCESSTLLLYLLCLNYSVLMTKWCFFCQCLFLVRYSCLTVRCQFISFHNTTNT